MVVKKLIQLKSKQEDYEKSRMKGGRKVSSEIKLVEKVKILVEYMLSFQVLSSIGKPMVSFAIQ